MLFNWLQGEDISFCGPDSWWSPLGVMLESWWSWGAPSPGNCLKFSKNSPNFPREQKLDSSCRLNLQLGLSLWTFFKICNKNATKRTQFIMMIMKQMEYKFGTITLILRSTNFLLSTFILKHTYWYEIAPQIILKLQI